MKTKKISTFEQPNRIRRNLMHSAWVIPVVMSVNLPAHAQTSQELVEVPASVPTVLSSSAVFQFLTTVVNNGDTVPVGQNLEVTLSTTPPLPGATVNFRALCNGLEIGGNFNQVTDLNGQLTVTIGTPGVGCMAVVGETAGLRFTLGGDTIIFEIVIG